MHGAVNKLSSQLSTGSHGFEHQQRSSKNNRTWRPTPSNVKLLSDGHGSFASCVPSPLTTTGTLDPLIRFHICPLNRSERVRSTQHGPAGLIEREESVVQAQPSIPWAMLAVGFRTSCIPVCWSVRLRVGIGEAFAWVDENEG
jgi:hypothetical protein